MGLPQEADTFNVRCFNVFELVIIYTYLLTIMQILYCACKDIMAIAIVCFNPYVYIVDNKITNVSLQKIKLKTLAQKLKNA